MKLTTAQKAFAAIIIANLIWGVAAVIFKVSLENIPPFTLAFWRFFLGAILLALFLRKDAGLPTKNLKDLYLLIGYAFTGITINIIFFFLGLRLTLSINSPIISSSQPLLIYLLALLFLREKFYLNKMFGMILGTAGIVLIVIEPLLLSKGSGNLTGNIFLVLATIAAVFQTIIGKKVLSRVNPLAFTLWAFIVGAASFLPLAIYEFGTVPNLYQSLDMRGFAGIAFGSIFSSAVAYGLYAWGLSKINASDVSMFSYIDPVIGTVLGALVLHEPINSYFIWGSILIFGGILIAEKRLHYHKFQPAWFMPNGLHASELPPKDSTPQPHHPTKTKQEILSNIFGDSHKT